jgi:predicted secreted protein
MSLSLGIAIYFLCWWIVLFAILPLRIGPQPKEGERDAYAEAAGAPLRPNLPLKFLLTTLVSLILFALVYVVIAYRLISLNDFPL